MRERRAPSPLFSTVAELVSSYRDGTLSPVEVTTEALERIERLDTKLHAYITVTEDLALEQARYAEDRYRDGSATAPLLGVPTSIKDLFAIESVPTSLGSLVYRDSVANEDSTVVAALRRAGAVFLGKTNTPEFGQSATTENMLGPGCGNPWNPDLTAGGSSGGAAASVAAGLASVALGSDGGGSIRIPAAMCGLFGLKPTTGLVPDDGPFHAMTQFSAPGPLVRRVADARPFMAALVGRDYARGRAQWLRIAWCPRPEEHPVERGVLAATEHAVELVAGLGHTVEVVTLPISGWRETFRALVLADEGHFRGHLLADDAHLLTGYARRSIEAAARVSGSEIEMANTRLLEIRQRISAVFDDYDVIATPSTASVAFPIGDRPPAIDGQPVDRLWGPFPFTAPFNVAGTPAASIPCGLSKGLPVGLQLIARASDEQLLLDLCEDLEEVIEFPMVQLAARWALDDVAPDATAAGRSQSTLDLRADSDPVGQQ